MANIRFMDKLREWLKTEGGRLALLASACGLTHGTIIQWRQVPPQHLLAVERVTGISRHELRPDLSRIFVGVETAA